MVGNVFSVPDLNGLEPNELDLISVRDATPKACRNRKRNGEKYILVVQSKLFGSDYWWLLDNEEQSLATNKDEDLIVHIDGTSNYSEMRKDASKD